MELDVESGFRVRISSQGLLTIYKMFPENKSGWKVNELTRLFGLFQRKVSGSNVANSGKKMKRFRLAWFGKLQKTWVMIRGNLFIYYFSL